METWLERRILLGQQSQCTGRSTAARTTCFWLRVCSGVASWLDYGFRKATRQKAEGTIMQIPSDGGKPLRSHGRVLTADLIVQDHDKGTAQGDLAAVLFAAGYKCLSLAK